VKILLDPINSCNIQFSRVQKEQVARDVNSDMIAKKGVRLDANAEV
jgi:hypothetical protein